jgi:hypothetical protein
MLAQLTREAFDGQLNQIFLIKAGDANIEAELVDCRSLPGEPEEGGRQPFSLLFRGPLEPALPQRIYEVRNENIGPFEIFLVPIGPDKVGMQYEAVFT